MRVAAAICGPIDLGGLDLAKEPRERAAVGEVGVVQEQARVGLVAVLVEVVQPDKGAAVLRGVALAGGALLVSLLGFTQLWSTDTGRLLIFGLVVAGGLLLAHLRAGRR
jgi:hypothetical protein